MIQTDGTKGVPWLTAREEVGDILLKKEFPMKIGWYVVRALVAIGLIIFMLRFVGIHIF